MDHVIQQFLSHVSPHTLIGHRDAMRHFSDNFSNLFTFSIGGTHCSKPSPHGGVDAHQKAVIGTGSFVEGANLARVFGEKLSEVNEMELDFMYQVMILDRRIFEVVPIEECPTFAHITSNVQRDVILTALSQIDIREYRPTEEDVNEVLVEKEGHLYISSVAISNYIASQLQAGMKDVLNNAFIPGTEHEFNVTPGSASIELKIMFPEMNDESVASMRPIPIGFTSSEYPSDTTVELREACRPNELPTSDENRIIKYTELIQERVDIYKEHANDLMVTYGVLVSEIEQLISAGHLLEKQTSKAREVTIHCKKMTDFVFSSRKHTIGLLLKKQFGNDWSEALTNASKQTLDDTWQQLLEQLQYSEEDGAQVRLEAALGKMETMRKKVVIVLRAEMKKLANDVKSMLDQMHHPESSSSVNKLRKRFRKTVRYLSFDFVPCVRFKSWPSVAKEWVERQRVWPEKQVIEEIVNNGTHFVVKAHRQPDIDWRLSFSIAEVRLAGLWTEWQHYIYFIFKSLYYKYIKPLDTQSPEKSVNCQVQSSTQPKKYLPSFLAKTVMSHVSEMHPQSWWNEANASECLTVLLLALQSAFETRNLTHYFIPSVNLLRGIPDDLASSAADVITTFFDDSKWATGHLETHFMSMKTMLDAVEDMKISMRSLGLD